MPFSILGLAISGLIAFILLLVGFIGLVGKGSLGSSVRGVLGIIPIGSPKLWAVVIVAIGLMAGGIGYATSQFASIQTAGGLTGSASDDGASSGAVMLDNCQFSTYGVTPVQGGSTAFRTDPNDQKHLYLDVSGGNNSLSLNGTIVCNRVTDNIRNGQSTTCEIVADSFRNERSTTDSNTYYVLATSASKSAISGMPWQQTAYLQSGALATTASNREKTSLVFAQDTVQQTLGFYATLPGETVMQYRNNQTANDLHIKCGNQEVGKVTLVKIG